MKQDASLHVRSTAELVMEIFESSPDCVKLVDTRGQIVAMNANGRCAMEIDDACMGSGTSWAALWPDASRRDIEAALATAATGATGHFRAFCPTATGTPRWWEVVVTPVRGTGSDVESFLVVSHDVTAEHQAKLERERLVRELQAANERMSDIFRQAPAFMAVVRGPDHVFEIANERYQQLIGGRNPVGQPVRQALPELEGQDFVELLDQVYRTGAPFKGADVPILLRRAPGQPLEKRIVDFVYMALKDAEGATTGILAHGFDQTERKAAEIALFDSRERFHKIVSQAGAGVVEVDAAGRIILANQKYCAMMGYTEAELIGRDLLAVTAPESAEATRAALARLKANGLPFVIDKQYQRKDGTRMWATSSVNALRDAAGGYQGLVAIVVDITQSRQTADALRSSEERYRTLFGSMDQGFCIIDMIFDAAGKPVDYRFLEMNHMFEEHTGLANAAHRTVRELVPDLDDYWFEAYGHVALTGEPLRFEHEAAAMQRWFDVHATRVGGPGSTMVALLFRDITARKRTEQELQDGVRRRDEFLAMLAHELRNPLAPIGAAADLLQRADLDHARVKRTSEIIGRQVRHMTHLIDDLLDVSRVTRGLVKLDKTPLPIAEVVNDAVEQVTPLIRARRHSLAIELAADTTIVRGDKKRLVQVVANLLNNAAKYTQEGGHIRLRTAVQGATALIEVSDDGVGMTADLAAHAFDLFSQAERASDRSAGGLGLGLALVKSLVELHHGRVSCDSPGPGQGSTFVVRLPLADRAERRSAEPDAGSTGMPATRPLRIMVVDDNADAAAMLGMLLEAAGHDVVAADRSSVALERARNDRPDVCLLDIGLPEVDGYELARLLRTQAETAGALLIAVTGYGQEADRMRALSAGFDHHLVKPVDTDQLAAILAHVDKGRSQDRHSALHLS